MLKKILSTICAVTLILGVIAASIQPAEARRGRGVAVGVGLGLLGLGLLATSRGAYADGPGACYPGPRQCGYVGRQCFPDAYGNPICQGGHYRCWRPTICD